MVLNPGLAPIRSVPLLVRVPVPRLMFPPVSSVPLLMKDALLDRLKLAPNPTLMVPALAANPEDDDMNPADRLMVPTLVKVVESMVSVWPATLALMMPLFRMLEA